MTATLITTFMLAFVATCISVAYFRNHARLSAMADHDKATRTLSPPAPFNMKTTRSTWPE